MHYACVVLHRWLKEFLAIHFPFVKEKPVPSVLIVNSLTTVLHRSEEHSCPVWTTPRTYSQSHLLLSVVPFVLTRMLTTLNMIKLGHAYSLKCGLSSPKQTRITPAFFFCVLVAAENERFLHFASIMLAFAYHFLLQWELPI